MRGHAVAVLFFLLQVEVAFDLVFGEHAAFGEEVVVSVKAVDGFLQAAADGWNLGQFCGWKIIQVLIHGRARVDLVGNAVKARHDDRREAQIGVGRGIREAHFHALGFRVAGEGNAARG